LGLGAFCSTVALLRAGVAGDTAGDAVDVDEAVGVAVEDGEDYYYFNSQTNESIWELPASDLAQ